MALGNGVDLGSIAAMLGNLVSSVEGMRVDMDRMRVDMDRMRVDMDQMRGGLEGLSERVERFRTETRAEFADVRQTIGLYHASVMGHGIAITELQEQVARINDHLGIVPAAE